MLKKIGYFIVVIFQVCLWIATSSAFNEQEHRQIDMQLDAIRQLSPGEQQEKRAFFSRLAQKSLRIRQAFLPIRTKIGGAALTKEDLRAIEGRIRALKELDDSQRNEKLRDFEVSQVLAAEIARSIQLESSANFLGYATAKGPTPLFRYPIQEVDINKTLGGQGTTGLNLDQQNLIRELAVVVPPGTVFLVMGKQQRGSFTYYQVRTREFDAGPGAKYGYFTDARFLELISQKPSERTAQLPSLAQIQKNLIKTIGAAYVWGGSRYQGLPQLEERYPSSMQLTTSHQLQKTMQGLDCSGLLYQATDSYTPRNTRQLLTLGEPVPIAGKDIAQILASLKPLDLILWAGHVVVVYDEQHTIESRWRANFKGGVELVATKTRLAEIMKTRTPVDDYYLSPLPNAKKFAIRRWYQQN